MGACNLLALASSFLSLAVALPVTPPHHAADTQPPLVGYDCLADDVVMTTISLLDSPQCPDFLSQTSTPVSFEAQIIQPKDTLTAHTKMCMVEYSRNIYHCGMHSHISLVHNGHTSGQIDLTPSKCLDTHRTYLYDHYGHKLLLNGPDTVTHGTVTLAGYVSESGSCSGSSFSVGGTSYTDVVVLDEIVVTIKEVDAVVNTDTGKINLPNGVVCAVGGPSCYHPIYGLSVVEDVDMSDCRASAYEVIYEGSVDQYTVLSTTGGSEKYVTVELPNTVFALRKGKRVNVCRENAFVTEHPKIFIIPKQEWGYKFDKLASGSSSVHLVPYINSKVQFLDLKVGQSIVKAKAELMSNICENSKRIVENRLMLAKLFPHQVASLHYNEPGYMGRVSGEALHIIKCKAVKVRGRPAEGCYQGIPVTYKNESWFLLPITRILSKTSVETTCTPRLPNLFRLGERWWSLDPQPRLAEDPLIMTVGPFAPRWDEPIVSPLGFGGLYPYQDLLAYEQALFSPVVADSGINNIMRKINGQNVSDRSFSSARIIGPEDVGGLQDSLVEHNWGPLKWLGKMVIEGATFIFFFILALLLMKLAIRLYKLWRVSGFGPWLLWSILSVFTETYTTVKILSNIKDLPCKKCHPCQCMPHSPCPNEGCEEQTTLYPNLPHQGLPDTDVHLTTTYTP